jgi:hypothetical protein
MKKSKQEIKSRILPMKRKDRQSESISPTEVTKNLFTDVWKDHVDEVRTMAGELQSEKLASITQKGSSISIDRARGPIRLSLYGRDE